MKVKIFDGIISLFLGAIGIFVLMAWLIAGAAVFPKFMDIYYALDTTRSGLSGFFFSITPLILLLSFISLLGFLAGRWFKKCMNFHPISTYLSKRANKGMRSPAISAR